MIFDDVNKQVEHGAGEFRLLTEGEAAKVLTLSSRTLQQLRLDGGGPDFVKLGGRRIAYEVPALRDWTKKRTRRSTSDPGAAVDEGDDQ